MRERFDRRRGFGLVHGVRTTRNTDDAIVSCLGSIYASGAYLHTLFVPLSGEQSLGGHPKPAIGGHLKTGQ
jgi:hypothetical protein